MIDPYTGQWLEKLSLSTGHYVQVKERELYFLVSSSLDRVLMISSFLAWSRSSRRLRASLVLDPAGLSLVSKKLLASLVCLQLVDVFHENPLVLEHVTLHFQVQAVIHVAVNLLRFTVSSEQSHWLSTLSLTYAHMPALPTGQSVFSASSSGMDSHRLPDDQPIFDQLPNLLAGVGVGDFIGFIGVQPDLLFATAEDTGDEVTPECSCSRNQQK
uniref:Uncharacterized protein n=1 Tax=Rhinolophus ferrumequinum TaxID=59479 RepID=A0A671E1U5_RHIFE